MVGSPAAAGLSRVRRAAAALVAVALLLGGCAVGGGGDEERAPGALPEALSEAAQPLTTAADGTPIAVGGRPGSPTPTTATAGGGATAAPSTTTRPAAGQGGGSSSAPPTTVRPFRHVASVADRTGDAGLQARPHGDLVSLRLEDDGTRARVIVQLAGDLPSPPAEGEVMGIGVDLFRGDDDESTHQLFALGNADGWRAGLQAGSEWVEYPGTFELGGDTIVFTVPWPSVGGRRSGSLSAFADWSQARVAVVADASEDHAPDRGAQPFSF